MTMWLIMPSSKSMLQPMPWPLTNTPVHLDHALFVGNQGIPLQKAHCSRKLPKSQLHVVNSRASWIRPVDQQIPFTRQSTLAVLPPNLLAILPASLQSSCFTLSLLPQMSRPSRDLPCHFQPLACQPTRLQMTILLILLEQMTLPLMLNQPQTTKILVGPDLGLSESISNRHMHEFAFAGTQRQTTCFH